MKKYVLSASFFFIIFPALAEDIHLKVNLTESPPIAFADEQGQALGFFPEILKYIAKEEDWELEFVADTWSNSLHNLEEGTLDLMMSTARSEERERVFDFTTEPVISNWGQLVANKSVPVDSVEDLTGKKVAMNSGNIHTKNLLELLDSFSIQIEPIYTTGYADSYDLVEKGEVIAAVADRFNLSKYLDQYNAIVKTPMIYSPVKLYFAATKGRSAHILSTIDTYIKNAHAQPDSFFYDAMDRWFGTSIAVGFKLPKWVGISLYLFGLAVAALTVVVLFLRMQVTRKTTELRQKNMEGALRESEELLRQAQKLESVGRLAGGVAHNFNNLLTTIIGYSNFIAAEEGISAETEKGIKVISESADRADTLTRQLLAFSRKQLMQPQSIDLNELIMNAKRRIEGLIQAHITFNTILCPEIQKIKADPEQIDRVMINLAVNARDAMPNGGTFAIETKNVYLDESDRQSHPEIIPGYYVEVIVSDTGLGMDEETLEHIFDPFYTTKEVGKGTGMGLATVYGIVKQSEGHIWPHSERNHGTTFRMYFPVVAGVV